MSQAASNVESNVNLLGHLPPRSSVGSADLDFLNEGQKVILSNGEQVPWEPPPAQPVMPDMSRIKSIRHYFNRKGFQVYPAWLYHPTQNSRLVKDAAEAAQLGLTFRRTTQDERGKFGVNWMWDWQDGCEWRPTPFNVKKFDPSNPDHGKNYMPSAPNPIHAQNQLIESLIPAVAAAVAQSLNAGPGKPANIPDADWQEFVQFKAWKEAQTAVQQIAEEAADDDIVLEPQEIPGAELSEEQQMALWLAEAERKGVKIDKRWGLARLKEEVEKAA